MPTVLVVDDELSQRQLVAFQIRQLECAEVLMATDGEDAQRILAERQVDLVVTDLLMPNLDGLGLMRWALHTQPDAEWIVLSQLETFDAAAEAIRFGAFDFLTKPVQRERLQVAVRNALEHRRLKQDERRLLHRLHEKNRTLTRRVTQLETLTSLLERQANETERDLERAASIQRALLPPSPPCLGGFRVETLYRPGLYVGGDLYDIIALDPRYVGVLIADACGHGVSAAMLSVLFKQHLRLHDPHTGAPLLPTDVLGRANLALADCGDDGLFVTAAYGVLDTETGTVRFASAGHPPVFCTRADGGIEALERSGPALGLDPDAHFEEQHLHLDRGDRLFLYTDGLLGESGHDTQDLQATLRVSDTLPAIFAALDEDLRNRGEAQTRDDVTAIALEARVGPSRFDSADPEVPLARAERPRALTIRCAHEAEQAWLQLSGWGGWGDAETLLALVAHLARKQRRLLIDFGGCQHLDSTLLGTLHAAVRRARATGCEVTLQRLAPELLHLFDELSLLRLLECVAETPEPLPALENLEGSQLQETLGPRVLRAHEELARLSPENRETFRGVIEGLRAELRAN